MSYGRFICSCPWNIFDRRIIPAMMLDSVGVFARVTKHSQQHQFHVVKAQALCL